MRFWAGPAASLFIAFVLLSSAEGRKGGRANDDDNEYAVGAHDYGSEYDDSEAYGDDDAYTRGPQYNSPKCEWLCKGPGEFQTPLPRWPPGELNRAHDWGIVLLNQIHDNLDRLSPPGVARILGVFSSCLHDVLAYDEAYGVAAVYARQTPFSGGLDINRVIDGAAFAAIRYAFENDASFEGALAFLDSVSLPPFGPGGSHASFTFGAHICEEVVQAFTADGFKVDGDPLTGITDCAAEINSLDFWQPLCVPTFYGSQECEVQNFLAPDAYAWTTFALPYHDAVRPNGPPLYSQNRAEWERQAREIVDYSASLSDVPKMLAEFWADGPDTTAPPGHWYKIAMDACVNERLSLVETVKVLFLVGHALNDAGVASWDAKRHFDFIRPITMIQCGFGGQTVGAWAGPYLGVGTVFASQWQPYQATTFVTPAFPGYVSGHSTFSAAASLALEKYFGKEYLAPKCHLIPEGASLFERRIDAGQPGYIPGLTDVPNNGPRTKGYAPGTDVVLCWEHWKDAGLESGISRFHGGIHILADHVDGVDMGYQIAEMVFQRSLSYWGV